MCISMDLIWPGIPRMGCGVLTETTPLHQHPRPPRSLSVFHSLSLCPAPRWEISPVLTEATFVLLVPGAERYGGPSPHLNKQHLTKHLLHREADSESLFQLERRGATCFPLKEQSVLTIHKELCINGRFFHLALQIFAISFACNRKATRVVFPPLTFSKNYNRNQWKHR